MLRKTLIRSPNIIVMRTQESYTARLHLMDDETPVMRNLSFYTTLEDQYKLINSSAIDMYIGKEVSQIYRNKEEIASYHANLGSPFSIAKAPYGSTFGRHPLHRVKRSMSLRQKQLMLCLKIVGFLPKKAT